LSHVLLQGLSIALSDIVEQRQTSNHWFAISKPSCKPCSKV